MQIYVKKHIPWLINKKTSHFSSTLLLFDTTNTTKDYPIDSGFSLSSYTVNITLFASAANLSTLITLNTPFYLRSVSDDPPL